MKTNRLLLCIAIFCIVAPSVYSQAVQKPAQMLPLKRIIFYSNGVAYFERRGKVTGNAEINLPFKQSQVDDVLKSLVVLDMGKGKIGAVSYNSSAPPAARLSEIPFEINSETNDNKNGLAHVLSQLQGARATVSIGPTGIYTGSILTIGKHKVEDEKNKTTVVRPTVVLSTDTGELREIDLKDVRSIKLLDEGVRTDIKNFTEAVASTRRRDAKTITITSDGEGEREMIVSYTIAAPIWKTTYRVVLDQNSLPFFQGWAVVDNVGEENWDSVSLSLVSGTPVSFIQNIQKPLYRYRPVIPIPADLRLDPQVYEEELSGGGIGVGQSGNIGGGDLPLNARRFAGARDDESNKKVINQSVQISSPNQMVDTTSHNTLLSLTPAVSGISTAITSGEAGVETAASASELGELFEYRVDRPVTIRRDRSALIPILQSKMEGERISIYNESTRRDRPMYGMRLKNTSNLVLEAGSIAVIDGDAYAGESLIERLKPNEQRFISFGLDLGTIVTSKVTQERQPTFMVRTVKGVFEAYYHLLRKQTYTLINQTDKSRVVYIEHPFNINLKLSSDTPPPSSKSTRYYRFRIQLEPRQTIEFPVVETQPHMEGYQLAALTSKDLDLFIVNKYIDPEIKKILENLINLKNNINKQEAILSALETESDAITKDQTRLRENIETLKNNSQAKQLIQRYISKADQQETRIEQIAKEKQTAQQTLDALNIELDNLIGSTIIEKKF